MAKKLAFDRVLFTTIVVLLAIGLVMVYSASVAVARGHGGGVNPFLKRQAEAAVLGLGAMFLVMHLDYRRLRHPVVVYGVLAVVAVLLAFVLAGPELNATRRWFFVSGVSVQPSELAKLALILFLAYQIEKKQDRINTRDLLLPCAIVVGLIAGLIVAEPDLGTALLVVGIAAALLFLAGLSWKLVCAVPLAAAPVVFWLIFSEPYRRARIFAFLEPERDPLGSGFQALQSLIAVGSGGVLGLGPGNSVQKMYFLPYPHSDFIYAIIAEELGMIGALAVVALFGVVLWRGLRAGWRAPDAFGRYLGWGLTLVLVLQAFTNISVALALLPTKGIPLPFLSYGGSSLVATLTACGVLLNLSQHG